MLFRCNGVAPDAKALRMESSDAEPLLSICEAWAPGIRNPKSNSEPRVRGPFSKQDDPKIPHDLKTVS